MSCSVNTGLRDMNPILTLLAGTGWRTRLGGVINGLMAAHLTP
jgi:hypothetical protein